ncbi:hypothetical protein BCT47_21605 [Vibrio splendidus]|uniref:Recombinase family protein n=1 Tax=Vibrio splendidus TaxID=29497 RepID=A0AB35N1Z9_VIBSP|nr:recombinase family protein [Vibrio splendidus]MDP2502886.1 recombinase family protein [Vibrio splendidus]PMM74389.1 hypothetical protein BCT47_21605 [Vibrio splendidus]
MLSDNQINVYAYKRLSDVQQGKNNRSGIFRQSKCINEYIEGITKNGYSINLVELENDIGRSAYHGKHITKNANFGAFLEEIKKGNIPHGSWLLVEDVDRLTRQHFMTAVETTINPILAAGIEIHVLSTEQVFKGELNLSQQVDLLVKVDSANLYTKRLSKRTKGHWDKTFSDIRDGKRVNIQSRPLWLSWDKEKGEFFLNEKAPCIGHIFEMYIAGTGYRGIADALNRSGVPSLKNRTWQIAPIKRILKDPSTYGRLEYINRGLFVDEYFPAVVPKETFDTVQVLMQKKGSSRVRTSLLEKDNTLQGLAYCECGSPMYHKINSPKKHPRGGHYIQTVTSFRLCCTGKNNGNGCNKRDLYYPIVKEVLITSSDTFNTNKAKHHEIIDHTPEIERLEKQNQQILELTLSISNEQLLKSYIEKQEQNLEQIAELRMQESKPILDDLIPNIPLSDLTEMEINNYLRLIIKRVDVYSEGTGEKRLLLEGSENMPVLVIEYYDGHKQTIVMRDMRSAIVTKAWSSTRQGNLLN